MGVGLSQTPWRSAGIFPLTSVGSESRSPVIGLKWHTDYFCLTVFSFLRFPKTPAREEQVRTSSVLPKQDWGLHYSPQPRAGSGNWEMQHAKSRGFWFFIFFFFSFLNEISNLSHLLSCCTDWTNGMVQWDGKISGNINNVLFTCFGAFPTAAGVWDIFFLNL